MSTPPKNPLLDSGITKMKTLLECMFGKKQQPSKLALSIVEFTNESYLVQLHRQNRFYEFLSNK
jgi:hypothetical protein